MRIVARRSAGPGLRLGAAAFAVVGLAACGGSSSTPTTPAAPTSTETFTGTVSAGGVSFNSFTVAQTGTLTATLVSLSPQATITMGFGIGQPATTGCSLISADETSRVGSVLQGTIDPGTFCVELYDIGNVQGSVDYTVTVDHP
jgi:hypothetical protein